MTRRQHSLQVLMALGQASLVWKGARGPCGCTRGLVGKKEGGYKKGCLNHSSIVYYEKSYVLILIWLFSVFTRRAPGWFIVRMIGQSLNEFQKTFRADKEVRHFTCWFIYVNSLNFKFVYPEPWLILGCWLCSWAMEGRCP